MTQEIQLPVTNEYGYYEIRLEAIGGLGANLSGKLLGELGAIELNFNAASFSSYGSEKRGSPVKAYIRWCKKDLDLRTNSPVKKPHILGIFHEALAGKEDVVAGVEPETNVIINTSLSPEEAMERFQLPNCRLTTIDALKIALESKTRVNMVMLGAVAKASGFIPLNKTEELIDEALGKKYPALSEQNKEGIRRGYKEGITKEITNSPYPKREYTDIREDWGYLNAPIGGVNPSFGSSVSNDISGSREGYVPILIKEKCINCGLCDTTCPDMVFQFVEGEYKGKKAMVNSGLDYKHCKGCLRCVEICPTKALVQTKEREVDLSKLHHRNKDLIVETMEFEHTGPNSWVTSDSFLEEKQLNTKEEEK